MFKGLRIKMLTEQMNNSDWKKREEAAKLLGELGDPSAVEPLIKALGDYMGDVRKAAAEALGRLKDPRAEQPLLRAFGDGREDVRFFAAKALGELKGPRAVELFITILEDGNENARAAAVRALGECKDPQVIEPLIKTLGDEAAGVRTAAAAALSKLGERQWKEIIKGDAEDFSRLRWTGTQDSRVVAPFIKALGNKNVQARSTAAEALGELKNPRAVEPLIKALEDKNGYVRATAAKALGEFKDSRAVEPLVKSLKDADGSVRKAAAKALGEINDPRAAKALSEWKTPSRTAEASQDNRPVERLIKALGDDDWGVRKVAAKELGELKDPQAIEALIAPQAVESLIKTLGDDYKEVRLFAARALGRLNDLRAVEALIKALGDDDWGVRKVAAKELGKLKDPRTLEPLIQTLEDDDENVRKTAAEALGKLEDPRAAEAIKAHRWSKFEDWQAAEAIKKAHRWIEQLVQTLDVCKTAAESLGEFEDPRAAEAMNVHRWVKPLIQAFEFYSDKNTKQLVAKALVILKDPRAVEPLIKALGADEDFRRAMTDALNELGESKWKEIIKGDAEDFSRLVESKDSHTEEILINAIAGWNEWNTRKEAAISLITFAKNHPDKNILSRDIVLRIVQPHEDSHLVRPSDCSSDHFHSDYGIGIPESEVQTYYNNCK